MARLPRHDGSDADDLTPEPSCAHDARQTRLPDGGSFAIAGRRSGVSASALVARHVGLLHDTEEGGKIDTNPAADLTVDNVRVGTRPDFTRDETVLILTAARERDPEQRWFTWMMAATGASNREIYSCERADFSLQGETIVWDLRGTKTDCRERTIPLPSFLAREGFWQFIQSRPGKLFTVARVDEQVNNWIKSLKIAKTVYSFRHRLATQLRNPKLAIGDDLQRYYLGHSGGDVHATYGETLVDYLIEIIERVPAPV